MKHSKLKMLPALLLSASLCLFGKVQAQTSAPPSTNAVPTAAPLSLTNNPIVNIFNNVPTSPYNTEKIDINIGSVMGTTGLNFEQVYKGLYCFGTNSTFAVGADLFAGQGSQYADSAHGIFQLQRCQAKAKEYIGLFGGDNFLNRKPEGGASCGACYLIGNLGCGLEGRVTISGLKSPPGIGAIAFLNWPF